MDRAFGLDVPRTLDEVCARARLALVVYDMQVGVVRQIPRGDEIVAKVAGIVDAARSSGFRIFYTRHMALPNEVAGVGQLRRARVWQGKATASETTPFMLPGSPEGAIVPELTPRSNEVVVDKITMSAFAGTFLEIALRDAGLDAFAIAGIAMEIGIEPTVRHGSDLNFIPVVAADACGSRDEAAYRRSIDGFAFAAEALITDTATLVDAFQRQSAAT